MHFVDCVLQYSRYMYINIYKKFSVTCSSENYAVSIKFEKRYLAKQMPYKAERLLHWVQQDPLKDDLVLQNINDKIFISSLLNHTV